MTGYILLQTLCYFNDVALKERKLYQEGGKKNPQEANSSLGADFKQRMDFWPEMQYRQKFGKKPINQIKGV